MSKKDFNLPFVIRAMSGCGVPRSEHQASQISKEDAGLILDAYKNKKGRGILLSVLQKIESEAGSTTIVDDSAEDPIVPDNDEDDAS